MSYHYYLIDDFVKIGVPIATGNAMGRAALRFILRHCGVLKSTPHSSGFARLAYGAFYKVVRCHDFLHGYHPIDIIKYSIILSLILLLCIPVSAASLSVDIGKNSTSFGIGTDLHFGYGVIGISSSFITNAPWSYVQTEETLTGPCNDFTSKSGPENELRKKCTSEGRFNDGDEWEVFAKAGFRLPLISSVYLNTGLGLSSTKSAQLYVFSEEYCTYRDTSGACLQKAEYGETWGEVDRDYFMTFLGGISVEMNRRVLLNMDYHSRKGLIAGLIWRY